MLLETGKAARQIDGALDYVSQMKAERDDLIASYEWQRTYAFIVIQQLAQDCTPEQAEILLDLCKVLYQGEPDE